MTADQGTGANSAIPGDAVVLAHSSDLHLASETRHEDDLARLQGVLEAALAAGADALLLAGDIFDHNRVKLPLIDAVGRRLQDAALPVIILPGNHDCLAAGSVYRRGGLGELPNVEVLGITVDELLPLAGLDLEVWGRPHPDHVDMAPLREPAPRGSARWRVAIAHGHWVSGPQDLHRSWLIHQEELDALQADYLALGHWDLATKIGAGALPAYYSGSPDLAKTINLVRLSAGGVEVTRMPLPASTNGGADDGRRGA
ncbi:MAG TPA: metallophosphoesterase [Dehalococcoidia bacterium]|nr:metallophosphoesterase [Dehalococcoidia bacterium]